MMRVEDRWSEATDEGSDEAALASGVTLRYLGRRTMFLRGAVTSRVYMARRAVPLLCDVRDAPTLLANPLFKSLASARSAGWR
jgi:hypothetical protein